VQPTARVSDDEYLALERAASDKHELVNGRVMAMSGATPRHNAIVLNVASGLLGLLRGKGCRPLASDQRVHVPATGLYTYPDVIVVCGSLELHPRDSMTVVNPRVIVEVLSATTEAYDRGAKFAHYRSIVSLQTYVMLSPDEPRVERYERGDAGLWVLHEAVGLEASLELPALAVTLALRDLYADLPDV
jgi:Uma2 family endonuclease